MLRLNDLIDVRIIFILYLIFVIIVVVLSIFIFLLIVFNKTLHSPANLLICNTCLSTILYFIMTTIKIIVYYMQLIISDWSCRVFAFLAYSFLHATVYSYVIQALSRLFFIVFHQHQHFLHYKFHFILIISQTLLSFLISLSSLITKDVSFRQLSMCYIPSTRIGHIFAFFITSYLIPFFIIIIIYMIIYWRVIRSSAALRQSTHETKRDLRLIRNILILFLVFLSAGIPWIIYAIIMYTIKSLSISLYLMPLLGTVFAATLEKIGLMCLNHEIRRVMRKLLEKLHLINRSNRIMALPSSATHAYHIPMYSEIPNMANKRASMITIF